MILGKERSYNSTKGYEMQLESNRMSFPENCIGAVAMGWRALAWRLRQTKRNNKCDSFSAFRLLTFDGLLSFTVEFCWFGIWRADFTDKLTS